MFFGKCGDHNYLAVWDHVLVPVAKSYNPDMVLIFGGFDAALGDPLGECRLTPHGYSLMTRKLMEFAGGKIVLALEGGYNLKSVADSFAACVETLLTEKPIRSSADSFPFESSWRVIQAVRNELSSYWPALNGDLPVPKLTKLTLSSSEESSESGEEYESTGEISSSTVHAGPVEALENIIEPLNELKIDDGKHDNKKMPNQCVCLEEGQ